MGVGVCSIPDTTPPPVPPAGVVRALHEQGRLQRVLCTETRPYNQGGRLTAFELQHDRLPVTLIADSAAAAAMRHHRVQGAARGREGAGEGGRGLRGDWGQGRGLG